MGKVVCVASTLGGGFVIECATHLHKGSFRGRGIWEEACIWEEASGRKHLYEKAFGGGICEEAFGRRHLGGGIGEEASWWRHLGGCIREKTSRRMQPEKTSGRKHLGGSIWEEASGRRHLGGGMWAEASGGRHLEGGIWEDSGENLGRLWGGSGEGL